MKRRTLLKNVGVGSLAVVAAQNTLGSIALADDDKVTFAFAAAVKAASGPFAATGDIALLTGSGTFGDEDAEGRGRLTHFRPTAGGPMVVATATWRVKKLTSFVQSGAPLGANLAGVAVLELEVRPDNGGKIPATLRVSCHLPGRPDPAFPEGIDLNSPAVGHFATFMGTTGFTIRRED